MKLRSGKIIRLFAVVYAGTMVYLLFFHGRPMTEEPQVNFVPFDTFRRYLYCLTPPYRSRHVRWAAINLLGNIGLFLPLGFLPPMLFRQADRLWTTLLLSLALMTIVELLQYYFHVGVCDVDDLILNLIGTAIGYGLYKGICRYTGYKKSTCG